MHREGEVINVIPVPAKLDCDEISVSIDTEYPFKNSFCYSIKAKNDITFTVRIPSFATNIVLNGNKIAPNDISVALKAGEQKELCISYDVPTQLVDRPHGLKSIQCGSLVFSIPVRYEAKMYEYERNGIERKFPYCDYEYLPTSEWRYALCSDKFTVERRDIADIPFSSTAPAVVLKTQTVPIDWGLQDGYDSVCAKIPNSTAPIGDEREIELYPYGSAKLRVTELPKV
jgi:hypothetical protein